MTPSHHVCWQPHSRLAPPDRAPEDNRLMFESVERLNATEPSKLGRSDT
jgi:hypothetical protein